MPKPACSLTHSFNKRYDYFSLSSFHCNSIKPIPQMYVIVSILTLLKGGYWAFGATQCKLKAISTKHAGCEKPWELYTGQYRECGRKFLSVCAMEPDRQPWLTTMTKNNILKKKKKKVIHFNPRVNSVSMLTMQLRFDFCLHCVWVRCSLLNVPVLRNSPGVSISYCIPTSFGWLSPTKKPD